MSNAKNKLKDAVEDVETLMDFLVEHTKDDIKKRAIDFDVNEELDATTSPFSGPDLVEQLQELNEVSLKAAGIAKNVPALIEECVELIVKHPRETKHLAEILQRMHVETRK